MPDIPCEERLRLERAVIVAIQGFYVAENSARAPVRIVDRHAMKALHDHIELHGCRGSHGVKATGGSALASTAASCRPAERMIQTCPGAIAGVERFLLRRVRSTVREIFTSSVARSSAR